MKMKIESKIEHCPICNGTGWIISKIYAGPSDCDPFYEACGCDGRNQTEFWERHSIAETKTRYELTNIRSEEE